MITDFGSVDRGIAHEAWLGLLDARDAGSIDRVDFIETVDTRDRGPNIQAFSERGYDIVVTVGAGMTDETIPIARAFPQLHYVGVQPLRDPGPVPANYAALMFHEEESGFLAGAAAALITSTGHVAAVCEASYIDSIRRMCDGFREGARHADASIDADVIYRSGPEELLFRDVEWGRATALQALDQGADVLFAVGEETAAAAMGAAADREALVIGAEVDQYAYLPEIRAQLVTSATLDVRRGVLSVMQQTLEGRFPAGEFWGEVSLAPFHDFEGRISPHVIAELERIGAELRSGAIHIDESE